MALVYMCRLEVAHRQVEAHTLEHMLNMEHMQDEENRLEDDK